MSRVPLEEAYPGISFSPASRKLWARLMRWPAECVHVGREHPWMATFVPDTLYLRGKPKALRTPSRPEVSLCRDCQVSLLHSELSSYHGRVVAFEPDGEIFTQYFFIGSDDFVEAGLRPEIAEAIRNRADRIAGPCSECGDPSTWLWISRREVSNLDQTDRIEQSAGALLCAKHGGAKLCDALSEIPEVNLFYVNVPYADAGAYVWI